MRIRGLVIIRDPVAGPPSSASFKRVTELSDAKIAGGRVINDPHGRTRAGLVYGLSAYTMWGIFPLYFRAVADVPPLVVLCHRIFWSALFMGLLISARGEWKPIRPVLRVRRNVRLLSAGAVLMAVNWLVFIYAVGSRQVPPLNAELASRPFRQV